MPSFVDFLEGLLDTWHSLLVPGVRSDQGAGHAAAREQPQERHEHTAQGEGRDHQAGHGRRSAHCTACSYVGRYLLCSITETLQFRVRRSSPCVYVLATMDSSDLSIPICCSRIPDQFPGITQTSFNSKADLCGEILKPSDIHPLRRRRSSKGSLRKGPFDKSKTTSIQRI